jgi:ATP-binding cassette subfamily B protein
MAPLFHLRGYLRRHVGALVLGVVFVLCGSGVALLGPLVLQRAIDSLGTRHPAHPLWQYALLIVAVALVNAAFSFGTRWTINSASRRIEYELRNDLFQHLQRLELAFFQQWLPGGDGDEEAGDRHESREYVRQRP